MDFWGDCFAEVAMDSGRTDYVATINCVPALVGQIYSIALSVAGIVALFFIVWGGIKFIRSGGDPKQLEGARHTIMYAIIGMIIVFLAYFILDTISRITGVECIKVFGFQNCATDNGIDASSADPTTLEGKVGCVVRPSGPPTCLHYQDGFTTTDGKWYNSAAGCIQNTECDGSG